MIAEWVDAPLVECRPTDQPAALKQANAKVLGGWRKGFSFCEQKRAMCIRRRQAPTCSVSNKNNIFCIFSLYATPP
jgi:hypothetical protein